VFKEEQTVFEINIDGDDYLASCQTMNVPLDEDTDLLPPKSMTDYRSVVGTIGYALSEFRPDLAWETSSLSRLFVTPTILDAKRLSSAGFQTLDSFEGVDRVCDRNIIDDVYFLN
jgi:hypothetical protein